MKQAIGQWKVTRTDIAERIQEKQTEVHIKTKMIKKEVFEISDTMDVLAQAVQGEQMIPVRDKLESMK